MNIKSIKLVSVYWLIMESAVNYVFRFAYAPYQFLKSFGIKGPKPTPFLGNYKDRIKMVKLSHVKCAVAVN